MKPYRLELCNPDVIAWTISRWRGFPSNTDFTERVIFFKSLIQFFLPFSGPEGHSICSLDRCSITLPSLVGAGGDRKVSTTLLTAAGSGDGAACWCWKDHRRSSNSSPPAPSFDISTC